MRCPKCTGCLYIDLDLIRCLNCGAHTYPPIPESVVSPRVMGTSLCEFCSSPRQKRSTTCRLCQPRERAIHQHGTGAA